MVCSLAGDDWPLGAAQVIADPFTGGGWYFVHQGVAGAARSGAFAAVAAQWAYIVRFCLDHGRALTVEVDDADLAGWALAAPAPAVRDDRRLLVVARAS